MFGPSPSDNKATSATPLQRQLTLTAAGVLTLTDTKQSLGPATGGARVALYEHCGRRTLARRFA